MEVTTPSLANLMAAIQGQKAEAVNKIDAVAFTVNLLREHLWKVSDRMTTAEQNVDTLQHEVCCLCTTASDLKKLMARFDECIEDPEW
ncbi:hypothetical protein NDU88_000247 [Pleurodeles waltl]|uniref:Uncharacterized protein n=1 Tax=Pleurodeles waltl TaxID=8319 RepID=A0AAV7S717_PLEWA|nr:hypothetical protein NDU88_000247 [Pleurodeles waltl]